MPLQLFYVTNLLLQLKMSVCHILGIGIFVDYWLQDNKKYKQVLVYTRMINKN